MLVPETTLTPKPKEDSENDHVEPVGEDAHQDNATDDGVVETETHTLAPTVEDPFLGGTTKNTLGPTFTTGGFDSAGSGMQPTDTTVSPTAPDEEQDGIKPIPENDQHPGDKEITGDSASTERKENTQKSTKTLLL